MQHIEALRDKTGEDTKDLKLNIQAVLTPEKLSAEQTWGCAIASAMFLQDEALARALIADATAGGVPDAIISDARAAAGLMAMNTVYYRFRHMVHDEQYSRIGPRLRMNRMRSPASDKATFELMAMSCAALEGCELCINSHAESLEKAEMTAEQTHEAVRIAAAVKGFSVAVGLADLS